MEPNCYPGQSLSHKTLFVNVQAINGVGVKACTLPLKEMKLKIYKDDPMGWLPRSTLILPEEEKGVGKRSETGT